MFQLRAPTRDDAPAVLRVLIARDLYDIGVPDFTLEDLLDQWRGNEFNLATDAVVAEDDGTIIGYATAWTPGALGVVDPAREGEGVGTRLLEWTERRERELGRPRHRQWVAERNATGHALLERAGYSHVRSYWRMARVLNGPPPAPAPIDGIELRAPVLPADAEPLYELSGAAFAANPDFDPESFATFADEHLSAHDFAPDLSRVAARGHELAGFALCRRWEEEGIGFVDLLAVAAEARGLGVGSALLLSAFGAFARAGLREAHLGVASDNPNALRLYEHAGMAPRFRGDVFERPME